MALAFHNLPHQEELAKEFLFYFISDTYYSTAYNMLSAYYNFGKL